MVAGLQVDQKVIALRAHCAQPAPGLEQTPAVRAHVNGEHALETGVCGEQCLRRGQRVQMHGGVGKRQPQILHDGSGQSHIAQGAP